jgi:hypothetical protein
MKVSSLLHPDVVGVYIGVIGIILACVFYARSKERMRPCILVERTELIGTSGHLLPESVEIRYDDKVIPALSKARITFWNAGRKTLDHSAIAANDPIAVKFPESEARILDVRSVITTRDVINARPVLRHNTIFVSFDFLEQNDGLAFEVFYDSESETAVSLHGTIKGVPGGIAVRESEDFVTRTESEKPGSGLRLMGTGLVLTAICLPFQIVINHWKWNHPDSILAIVCAVFGISFLSFGTYRYLHVRIPRALQASSQVVQPITVEKQVEDHRQSS